MLAALLPPKKAKKILLTNNEKKLKTLFCLSIAEKHSGGEKEMKSLWKSSFFARKILFYVRLFHREKFFPCLFLSHLHQTTPVIIVFQIFSYTTWVYEGFSECCDRKTNDKFFFIFFNLDDNTHNSKCSEIIIIYSLLRVKFFRFIFFLLAKKVSLVFVTQENTRRKSKESLNYVIFVISLMIRYELWHFYLFFIFMFVIVESTRETHKCFRVEDGKKSPRLV